MRNKYYDDSFQIRVKNSVKSFIENYGTDGEKLYAPYEEGISKSHNKGDYKREYKKQRGLRLFCKDCIDIKECKGKRWSNCEYRKEFQATIGRELLRKIGGNVKIEKEIRED